ncbi:UNVERIFIED_CONTAM: hypothetical protein RMT77_010499 [Armadillidium vulgare]
MRTAMNVLLLNLAFSDLLLGVVCMPFTLIGFLLRDFIFGSILCRIIPYLQAVSVSVSAYTLVTISFERYYGICHPLKTRYWRSLSHSHKMISVVWIVSFIFTVPIAVTSELQSIGDSGRSKCREVWPNQLGEQCFNMFLDVVLLIIPLFTMMTVYFRISRALWQHIISEREPNPTSNGHSSGECLKGGSLVYKNGHHRKVPQSSREKEDLVHETGETIKESVPESPPPVTYADSEIIKIENGRVEWSKYSCRRHAKYNEDGTPEIVRRRNYTSILRKTNTKVSLQRKKRIIKMLFVVVLEFFICWTPLFVINTVYLFKPEAVYGVLGTGGISSFQLLAYFSSCCNPITYCFMNATFRRAFLSAVGCKTQ